MTGTNPNFDAFAYQAFLEARRADYDAVPKETPAEDARRSLNGASNALLSAMCNVRGDCRSIGRKTVAAAWLAGALPHIKTQAALAKRLGVSRARASQIVSDLTLHHRRNAK